MDPVSVLGAAAASSQFVAQGIGLVKFLWELYSQMNNSPESIRRPIVQIEQLLSLSKLFLESESLQIDSVACILGTCILRAQEFHALLKRVSISDNYGRLKQLRTAFKTVMMEKDIVKLFESLEREKCTLMLCIQQVDVLQSTLLNTINIDIKYVKTGLDEIAHIVNGTAHNITTVASTLPAMSAQVAEIHTVIKSLESFTLDLQASAGSLSNKCHTTHYLVPNRRVREFVGREDVLSKIELGFTSSRTIVMRGLGGQGKTQVALEYCRRAKAHGVRMILWVDASSENSVNKNFETISESIKDSYEILQDETRVKFVMDTLEAWPEPWVMVFDNYDDPSAFNIQDYIPDTINGHILVTSRHADTEYLTDPEFAIELQGLPMQDALHLLLKQSRFAHTESNIQHGELVVKRLGYHALAITQAGSYIQLRKIKLEEFFDNYNKQLNRMEMFNQTPQMSQYRRKLSESAKETALNVFTTWELSFQQLQEQEAPNLQKSQVLTLFAFFDCKVISERLFQSYFLRNGLNNDQEGLIQSLFGSFTGTQNEWHHQAFVQSLSDLAQMSLIQAWSRDEEGLCQLSLHPLIKDWIRLRTDIVSFQNYMIITAWILADRLESCRRHNQFEMSLSNKQALLSHLDAYKENFESLKLGLSQSAFEALYDELETAEDWFSDFLRFNGSLTEAEAICRRLTVWRETNFGFQNEGPLSSLGDLALVLEDQGKYGESEEIILRVLDQRQNVLGRDHLDTLVSLHNLAFLLGRQSKYGEAETLTRLVLSHRQRRLGQDHPEVLTSLNNLALLLNCQGKYQVAEVINRAVLQCREVVLGHNHLDTITSMNNLGIDLRVQARSEEAEKLLQRALLHSETELGSEHPDTLCTIWNLAVLKEDQRKYDEALAYFERACRGCKKVLGPEHPDTLRCEEGYLQVLEERRIMEC